MRKLINNKGNKTAYQNIYFVTQFFEPFSVDLAWLQKIKL